MGGWVGWGRGRGRGAHPSHYGTGSVLVTWGNLWVALRDAFMAQEWRPGSRGWGKGKEASVL